MRGLHVKLLCVGSLKSRALAQVVEDYAARIRRMARLDILELPDESAPRRYSPAQLAAARAKEAAKLQKHIQPGDCVIALDIQGQMTDSLGVADKLEKLMGQGDSRLAFVIGSTLGLDESILAAARWRWSFSRLTFPHGLMRAMVAEQLYRALTILHNLPYNK